MISTINQHWRENLKKNPLKAENEQRPKRKRTRTVRTPEVVKKIKRLLASDNPPTQQAIGHRLGIRQQIVSQVVDQNLNHKRLKKPKAKHLSEAMVEKRKKRAKQFKKRVSGDNREYILTLDECMLPLDYTNGQSEYYYTPKNVKEIVLRLLQLARSSFLNSIRWPLASCDVVQPGFILCRRRQKSLQNISSSKC